MSVKAKSKIDTLMIKVIYAFIVGISFIKGAYLSETDIFWQIRSGQDITDTGQIISSEKWNWLVAGKEWMPNSWLWNIILAFFYDHGGIVAVGTFVGAFTALTLLLAWKLIELSGLSSRFVQFGVMLALIVAVFPWVSGRPQQADYMLLIIFYIVALTLKAFSYKSRLLIVTISSLILSMLWMNLHLTAPFGVFLFAAGYWAISCLHFNESWQQKLIASASVSFAGLVGLFITPFGISGLLKTLLVTDESKDLITEWMPPEISTSSGLITYLTIALFGIGVLLIALKAKQWILAIALVVLVIFSFEAIRFAPFLAIFALIAVSLIPEVKVKQDQLLAGLLAGLSAIVFVGGVVTASYLASHPNLMTFIQPNSLDEVPQGARLLTLPNGGSTAILFRPDISPSTDGRNDVVGKDQILDVIYLYLEADSSEVKDWLDAELVDAVFVDMENGYKITDSMEKIGWSSDKVPDGMLYLRT